MKKRNIALTLIGGTLVTHLGLLGLNVKRALDFKKTLNKNLKSLDEFVLMGGINKEVSKKPMQDLKIGAFYGGIYLDLSKVETYDKEYHLEIRSRCGGIYLIVPENVEVNFVDSTIMGGIETDISSNKKTITFNILADVKCGFVKVVSKSLQEVLSFDSEPELNI